jgi:hypothetical protein
MCERRVAVVQQVLGLHASHAQLDASPQLTRLDRK